MEKIEKRSMAKFILSGFINLVIGLSFGFVFALVILLLTRGVSGTISLLTTPILWGIILALLTGNMYRTYFYYRLSMDVNAVCKGDGLESESYVLSMVLSTLTFGLYEIYWTYKIAQRLRANAPRYGFKMLATGKEIAALSFFSFGYIAAWELIQNMNRIAKVYNQQGLPEVVGGVQ